LRFETDNFHTSDTKKVTGKNMEATNSLLPAQRQLSILDIIKKNQIVRSSQLSSLLSVSEMTIRRDLATLERKGMIDRTHGGAVFRQERMTSKFKYRSSKEEHPEEKEKIARKAAQLIEPNDVIFIGEGTTASLILRYVQADMPFTIFSNNHGVAAEIDTRTISAQLILLAGVYNSITYATAGNFTLEMIERITADKVFLGVDGFTLRAGLTTSNQDIAAINRAMIRHTAGSLVIMLDHTKFGLVAAMEIAKPKEIDVLITDWKIPLDFYNDLESMDINVITAE
jgi:DeoR family transcriptional regulator, fructose operon transcriptional repressor